MSPQHNVRVNRVAPLKGYVPTPDSVVDVMVAKLFRDLSPSAASTLLDPGSGRGAFIAGVLRWCKRWGAPVPHIVGVESDPRHARVLRERFAGSSRVAIQEHDFLESVAARFDYVIGNPPYVPITALTVEERVRYRKRYRAAQGRFDLYLLFFEEALRQLAPGGRLVFITPEKFLYVDSARALRVLLGERRVEELHFADEATFGTLVTYPLVTTARALPPSSRTRIVPRSGRARVVALPSTSASWLPTIAGAAFPASRYSLTDLCIRISCGVATGADAVFVAREVDLDPALARFGVRTISGRQLVAGSVPITRDVLLMPYDRTGRLLPESRLGALGRFLGDANRRPQLEARTCTARKPWYAFHETPPLRDALQPKILCKDIGPTPFFVVDAVGDIIPRHSVYFIVPSRGVNLGALTDYLNSTAARDWLVAHCQRAANGFVRLQSQVLKRLPVPEHLLSREVVRQLEIRIPGAVSA